MEKLILLSIGFRIPPTTLLDEALIEFEIFSIKNDINTKSGK